MQSKTILITGGTSGIGREAALLLASQGHTVFAASRTPSTEPMPGVTYLPLDVRSTESIQGCIQTVLAQTGQIDVLVNNAGYAGPAGASEEVSLDDARALFETNFFGSVQMVNAVLPSMRQRHSGLILNISSAAGRMAMPPFFGFYTASKHALEGYSEALSLDLLPLGIKVAIIEPGYFLTNIHNSFNLPTQPVDDFARDREHALALDSFCLRYGRNPRLVAEQISRLINGSPRCLRYPVGFDVQYMLFVRAILPERVFQAYLRWFLLGGQTLKLSDDDDTLRRKIGFRRFMLENPLADRLLTGTVLALGLLVLTGLAWWLL
jgi:NAD(P)-dependent dehydrogenase (short-subunit alcohol dehydrogenase family)